MANQIVTVKWTLGEANRVRETLVKRHSQLTQRRFGGDGLMKSEESELGELTDILARDFDWRPER